MKNLVITDGVVTDICDPNVEEVIIPEGVTRIDDYAFSAAKFKKIVFPMSLKTIGNGAFEECINLEEIICNDELEEIEASAFYHCKSVNKISLPDSLWNIEAGAFEGCNNVKEVICNNNSFFAFKHGCLIEEDCIIAASFGNMIPNDPEITTIKERAFGSDGHFIIRVPSNIKNIESDAFVNCDYLNHIEIMHEMDSVAKDAFCADNLNTIVLSSPCGNIAQGAFRTMNNNRCDIFIDGDYIPLEVYNCVHYNILTYYNGHNIPINDRAGTHNIWKRSEWKTISGTPVALKKMVHSSDLCNVYLCGVGYNIIDGYLEVALKIEDAKNDSSFGLSSIYFNKINITDLGFDYDSCMDDIDTYLYDDILISDVYSWDPNNFYLDIEELTQMIPVSNSMYIEFTITGYGGKISDSFEIVFDLPR